MGRWESDGDTSVWVMEGIDEAAEEVIATIEAGDDGAWRYDIAAIINDLEVAGELVYREPQRDARTGMLRANTGGLVWAFPNGDGAAYWDIVVRHAHEPTLERCLVAAERNSVCDVVEVDRTAGVYLINYEGARMRVTQTVTGAVTGEHVDGGYRGVERFASVEAFAESLGLRGRDGGPDDSLNTPETDLTAANGAGRARTTTVNTGRTGAAASGSATSGEDPFAPHTPGVGVVGCPSAGMSVEL